MMLSSALSLALAARSGNFPAVDFSFTSGLLPASLTFSRASAGTYTGSDGLIKTAAAGVARFDYDPSTLAIRGLLLEESRTNYATNGQATGAVVGTYGSTGSLPTGWGFAGGSTGGLACDIVGSGTEGALGYVDLRFYGTASSAAFSIITSANTTASSGQNWVASSFAKVVSDHTNFAGYGVQLAVIGGSGTTGVAPSKSTTGTLAANRKLSITALCGAGTTAVRGLLILSVVNGATIDFTIRVGGAQWENATFQTSYIPTTTAAATRASESLYTTNISWFNENQGAFIADIMLSSVRMDSIGQVSASLNNGGTTNRLQHYLLNGIDTFMFTSGGTNYWNPFITGAISPNVRYKTGLVYSNGNNAVASTGKSVVTNTSSSIPTGINRLDIGQRAGATQLNGWLQSFKYWNRALSGTELQRLTS